MILKKVDNQWLVDGEEVTAPFTRAVDALYDRTGLGLWFKLELKDGTYISEVKKDGDMYTGVFFIEDNQLNTEFLAKWESEVCKGIEIAYNMFHMAVLRNTTFPDVDDYGDDFNYPKTLIHVVDAFGHILCGEVELDNNYYYGSCTNLDEFEIYQNLIVLSFGGNTLEAAREDFLAAIEDFHKWESETRPKLNA